MNSRQGSRPGSTLDKIAATGAPPSRIGTRGSLKTGAPKTSASRRGTGTANRDFDMKDALTETLVNKMRERFASEAVDIRQQDLIGQEVVAFMNTGGSLKADDISGLEDRIRMKLAGGTGNTLKAILRKKTKDEWAMLAKFEQEQTVVEEFRRRHLEKGVKADIKTHLDHQMIEAEYKKQAEREYEQKYAEEEQRALEVWHSEEVTKLQRQKAGMERLKSERDAQILDRQGRAAKAEERRKREEEEANEMLRVEHLRKIEYEAANRQRLKERNEALKHENQAMLQRAELERARESEMDFVYQQKAIDSLNERDHARQVQIDKLKRMQDDHFARNEANSTTRPLKRWMDEGVIEKNFQQREALLDMQEEEQRRKTEELNAEQRRVLAAQLREKEARKKAMHEVESQRFQVFSSSIQAANNEEERRKDLHISKRHQIRADLEAQMREKAVRIANPSMSEVEKCLNRRLLDRVNHQLSETVISSRRNTPSVKSAT
mmetsp:Transcript_15599/g.21562  ORF Transcript_15599/g.21562 Transcript_15599/m.21562 type:complete len:492 (-) Transcript_15599:176-1651(-)|eukprot:CAMPEP_0196600782 /NCGR_PEP_ID=MMETSP1081-20130531/95569_1 /TAXON_ID=36882 /ORGANISM="Pyramimonas amylifera, Strain CCMP720" /LENGTH=491 /DNA_ID=CAMNT_0041926637 /DNA_START=128 /DNA_END=1603 /DNA_ORIENTATION=-